MKLEITRVCACREWQFAWMNLFQKGESVSNRTAHRHYLCGPTFLRTHSCPVRTGFFRKQGRIFRAAPVNVSPTRLHNLQPEVGGRKKRDYSLCEMTDNRGLLDVDRILPKATNRSGPAHTCRMAGIYG